MMDTASMELGQSIRRWQRIQFGATIFLFVMVGVVGLYAYHIANQSHSALCALRHNLERQINSSEQFIRKHPEGFAGISTAAIQAQVNYQISADNSLSGLGCAILPRVSKQPNRR